MRKRRRDDSRTRTTHYRCSVRRWLYPDAFADTAGRVSSWSVCDAEPPPVHRVEFGDGVQGRRRRRRRLQQLYLREHTTFAVVIYRVHDIIILCYGCVRYASDGCGHVLRNRVKGSAFQVG